MCPLVISSWASTGSVKVVAPLALARVRFSRLWFPMTVGTVLVRTGAGLASFRLGRPTVMCGLTFTWANGALTLGTVWWIKGLVLVGLCPCGLCPVTKLGEPGPFV